MCSRKEIIGGKVNQFMPRRLLNLRDRFPQALVDGSFILLLKGMTGEVDFANNGKTLRIVKV